MRLWSNKYCIWGLLCCLACWVCLPFAAFAAQQSIPPVAPVAEDVPPAPTLMPPLRQPALPPEILEKSILETLLKVEEEARRKAEAEARQEAALRERDEHEAILLEQRAAQTSARLLREQRQARIKIISDAIKSSMPPPPAVLPSKSNWPLPDLPEEPDWQSQAMALLYKSAYEKEDFAQLYRLCLREALEGNPRAMLVLAVAYDKWGPEISGSLAVLHPPMHNSAYWRKWAEQMTSSAWVAKRLADLSGNMAEKTGYYTAAAAQGDAEAMYMLATLNDQPELLVEAALLGQPKASSIVAFNLLYGTEGFPASPRMAGYYWWRAALGGDARALLLCSEYFYRGQNGFPKDARRACIFAMLAVEAAEREDAEAYKRGVNTLLGGTAQRHLNGLRRAADFSNDTWWEITQEMNILKAAPQEELFTRASALQPARNEVKTTLRKELHAVYAVLQDSGAQATEREMLAQLEQALQNGGPEAAQQAWRKPAVKRGPDFYFILLSLLVFAAVPPAYILARSGLARRAAKIVTN